MFNIRLFTILTLTALITTTFNISPLQAQQDETAVSDAELSTSDRVTDVSTGDLAHFALRIRWGYVRGNPNQDRTKTDYQGYVRSGSQAISKVRLVKTLLFEDNQDWITAKENPVSWSSTIAGHWDGVLIDVQAPAQTKLTVNLGNIQLGEVTKSVELWYEQAEPIVIRSGCSSGLVDGQRCVKSDQIVVIEVIPYKHRRQSIMMWWGIKNPTPKCPVVTDDLEQPCVTDNRVPVDFSGSIEMEPGLNIKLQNALRFERNDKITQHHRNKVAWKSTIGNGRDGLKFLLIPGRIVSVDKGINVTFDSLLGGWRSHYTIDEINKGVRETLTVGGTEYILIIGKRAIPRQLVKARRTNQVYLIKAGIRHLIPTNEILEANQFSGEDALVISDDELLSYAQGEDLTYPEGTIIDENDGTTSIISNGVRRRLVNSTAGQRLTRNVKIRQLTIDRLNQIDQGEDVDQADELPDNSLVKIDGDSAVWRIRGGKRQVFTSGHIFNLHRLDWNSVRTISLERLQDFDWTAPVEFPEGSLVKAPTDPRVYLLKNGKRFWVESEADFRGLGYKFSDVRDLPVTELVNYPEGEPLIGDEQDEVIKF